LGRLAPPEPAIYDRMEMVLRMVEEHGAAILAEHGVKVLVEHNRAGSSRGGKFPYLTFRAVGLLEPDGDPFLCEVCGDPGTTTVSIKGDIGGLDEPRCDEHAQDATAAA
jgi:hypothetical protein